MPRQDREGGSTRSRCQWRRRVEKRRPFEGDCDVDPPPRSERGSGQPLMIAGDRHGAWRVGERRGGGGGGGVGVGGDRQSSGDQSFLFQPPRSMEGWLGKNETARTWSSFSPSLCARDVIDVYQFWSAFATCPPLVFFKRVAGNKINK